MGTTTLTRSLLADTSFMGIITDALGTAVANVGQASFATDVGKAVKMATDSYIPTVVGDEIEGIINTVESGPTVNSGFSHGGIQTKGRAIVEVAAAQTATIAVGGYVCSAGTQAALGTAGVAQVFDTGTGYVAPSEFMWRVIRIVTGTGVAGDSVMIERV